MNQKISYYLSLLQFFLERFEIKRKFDYCIKDVFNNTKMIDYKEFEEVITLYFSTILKDINPEANFIIENNMKSRGEFGIDNIRVRRDVILDIYNGNITSMFIIFYELGYFIDCNNFSYHNIHSIDFDSLKERFINFCCNIENKEKFGRNYQEYVDKFYNDNHQVNISELNACINGYLEMVSYFQSIGIDLSEDDIKTIKQNVQKYLFRRLDKTRYYQGKKVDLDVLFQEFVRKYPELLQECLIYDKRYTSIRHIKNKRR